MEIELKDYLAILRKRIWLIVIVVLIACVSTAAISFYWMKPVYGASTKLIVNKSADFQGLDKIDLNSLNANIRLINTYKEIIKTPAVLDKVAAKYADLHLTPDQLSAKLQVQASNDSQVMTISAEDYSLDQAVRIVNAVAVVFQEEIPTIMKVDNVAILSEAKAAEHPAPIKPNKTLNVAIAFVVSLMVSVGIIFLLEYLDDTVKTEKDVEEYLGVPTLVTIMKTKQLDFNDNNTNANTMQKVVGEKSYASVNQ
ncbi:YveK family protein [Paenibacillus aestuarii]|uniref:YveK family protein n=1 Tax=Paenibacillus aestuarii TaxID=516965 RepID=A0ABW0K0A8_9BACL|nr:Wzz/FepE/Etk N-terminal domain-containing protein [Paenibacillus aestuarii]